jgi:zinc protease
VYELLVKYKGKKAVGSIFLYREMMRVVVSGLLLFFISFFCIVQDLGAMNTQYNKTLKASAVSKHVLDNGMTILVRPIHTIPKVSVQLWYNVGSKDETDKERGIAHLIEHMIFKGTNKLSESDINFVTHMLSGSCNAFTSYDYTGYLFNFPTQHWKESLSLMADCMTNCSFKDYMLNSEMKAVIQELKMYRDRYDRSLVDEMISMIFHDHPYHHPIIGYKQDLWSVTSNNLRKFYKKHYVPNKATLVVVGDIDPQEVFALSEEKFGSISADSSYTKRDHYYNQDIVSKSVTLYRDVKQPIVLLTFVVPGIHSKQDSTLELLARILGNGKGSRLYRKLVNEQKIATSVSASSEELFDHGLFFIMAEPRSERDIPAIEQSIIDELTLIQKDGITDKELTRAIKKTEMSLYSLMEDFEHQAYEIGKFYLATGDENYLFNYLNKPRDLLKKEIHDIVVTYLRPSVMHKGFVLPLPEQEKGAWAKLQKISDEEDNRILAARVRNEPVEQPVYAKTVVVKDPELFDYPKAESMELGNGVKVFSYYNDNTPKIDLLLDLKAKHYFDPSHKLGLSLFVSKMLLEGTKNYTADALIDAIESRGMSIVTYPGGIALSMLRDDFEFGLLILQEILTNATFSKNEIEKVRTQLLARLRNFWDEPRYFAGQLTKEEIYRGHPYSKSSLGTIESIKKITQKDLIDYYQTYISPHGARLAIVGDIKDGDNKALLEKTVGKWQGPPVQEIAFPVIVQPEKEEVNFPINRDQVVLRFAGVSVERMHPDYDKLLLFDQIFSGGALGSMASRLFQLREQSGLFYTIGGSLIAGADEQPGMFLVQTIVSLDRLQEAEKAIKQQIETAADKIEQNEFDEARRAIINAQVDNFSSNYNIANALLFLDRYGLPTNYFDQRIAELDKVSITDMTDAANKILKNKLLTLRVGRVGDTQRS